MDVQKDAWEALYRGQSRPWRGVADISWMGEVSGLRVLDLGCGNGKTSAALLEKGAVVSGADFSSAAIDSCRRLFGERADFTVADVRDLPYPDSSFDYVVSVHVLEHVPSTDIEKAADEIMRVTIPGGRLFLQIFAEGDMRSDGKKEDVRNGILYRYFNEGELRALFPDAVFESVELLEEPTRFGTVRRRYRCIIRK